MNFKCVKLEAKSLQLPQPVERTDNTRI